MLLVILIFHPSNVIRRPKIFYQMRDRAPILRRTPRISIPKAPPRQNQIGWIDSFLNGGVTTRPN
jgi:hypothetical protein